MTRGAKLNVVGAIRTDGDPAAHTVEGSAIVRPTLIRRC